MPQQFDEYVWFDETRAVDALPVPAEEQASADGHPLSIPALASV